MFIKNSYYTFFYRHHTLLTSSINFFTLKCTCFIHLVHNSLKFFYAIIKWLKGSKSSRFYSREKICNIFSCHSQTTTTTMSTIKKIINNTQTNEMYEWKEVCKAKLLFSNFSIALHLFMWLHMSMSCCCCYHTLMHNNRVSLFTIFVSVKRLIHAQYYRDRYEKEETTMEKVYNSSPQRIFFSHIFFLHVTIISWGELRHIYNNISYFTLLNFFMNIFQI